MVELFDTVVLDVDLPGDGLTAGTVGAVVEIYTDPQPGYEVEFIEPGGRTIAVLPVKPDQVRPAGPEDLAPYDSMAEGLIAVRVMAEYESFPLWVDRPDGVRNLDPSDLGLPQELAAALLAWTDDYDRTFDPADPADPADGGFASPEAAAAFNARGRELSEAVGRQLGPGYSVRYVQAS